MCVPLHMCFRLFPFTIQVWYLAVVMCRIVRAVVRTLVEAGLVLHCVHMLIQSHRVF